VVHERHPRSGKKVIGFSHRLLRPMGNRSPASGKGSGNLNRKRWGAAAMWQEGNGKHKMDRGCDSRWLKKKRRRGERTRGHLSENSDDQRE